LGQKLPPRQGRDIAVHRSFLSYVAVVAHLAVGNDGQVTIPQLDMAIDCGAVVNPDSLRAQLEGAAIMSIGNALYGNITMKEGRVEQSNYTDYLVPRIDITNYVCGAEANYNGYCNPEVDKLVDRQEPDPSSKTTAIVRLPTSPAVRYWNMARQRYYRS